MNDFKLALVLLRIVLIKFGILVPSTVCVGLQEEVESVRDFEEATLASITISS